MTTQYLENLRRGLLAKIHIAKKQLAMEDDSYRMLLHRITGKESAGQLKVKQLEEVLAELKRLGFKSTYSKGKKKLATDGESQKIRALWLNLWHLGELRDGSEEALAKYVKRMAKVAALQWLDSSQANIVIKGLRGWLQRKSWVQPDASHVESLCRIRIKQGIDKPSDNIYYEAVAAKASIIRIQYEIINQPISSFMPELMPADEMDALIELLGKKCREVKQAKES